MLVKVVRPTHIYITAVRLTHINAMIYHREVSLSKQYAGLLICHCTKQDLVTHKYRYVDQVFTRDSQVSHTYANS